MAPAGCAKPFKYIGMQTCGHRDTQTHRHTNTQTERHRDTLRDRYTDTDTNICRKGQKDTARHRETHRQTQTYSIKHKHTPTISDRPRLIKAHTNKH